MVKKLDLLKRMRQYFKKNYGLGLTTEIHAKELLRIEDIVQYRKISKSNRMKMLQQYAEFIPKIFKDCWVINVCFHKNNFQAGTDFSTLAFSRLIPRYNRFLRLTVKDEGIIIADESNEKPLRNLLRKMKVYNPVQSHYTNQSYNDKINKIIEDIIHRNSSISYFIQTVDVIAYLLKNKEYPKGSTKKFNLDLLFDKLDPILLKVASKSGSQGIVQH